MHKPFCIILLVVITPSAWTKTKWSKEIPDPESHLTRERRQFNIGDWIPLTQPCLTCRPLTDPADTGRIQDDIGLTPPRPPTVTRQIHKTSFFPQHESSILSVPPPPVFNRNQIPSTNTRFQNIFQQFNNPNSLQFDTQPVFPQTQFLPQTFIGNSPLLESNYPQVLPLLNNPSALLVQGNINSAQEIKTQKINHESKAPNLQDNVILEQNRQQQQPVVAPSPGLELPLSNEAVNFAPQRQQQNLIEGNILTPPPVPNSTIPDVIIPGLDKEEIQLLYVPLETLRQRSQQLEQQQKHITQPPQNVEFSHQQQSGRPTERPTTSQPIGHFITYSATPAAPTVGSSFQPFPVTPSTLFFQHLPFQGTQTPLISATPETPTLQTFVTPSALPHKFSSFPSVTPTENLVTAPENVRLTQEFLTTPKTSIDQLPIKDVLGKELNLEELHKINKLKSVSIENQERDKNFLLQQQKEQEKQKLLLEEQERERLKQQKLQREQEEIEQKQKLLREQEREKQQKLLREQKERERQQKLFREQQERERQQKLFREQQERERQQKLFREQQERERQQKLIREQQEKERQQKLIREQQERERQQKLIREQQERERQQKLIREQQERERQEKLYREEQEKLYREQQERERQEKLYREEQEKLYREEQEKLYREQQERERQEKLYREEQEKLYREQQERERQEKLYREEQEKLYREEQEKLYREEQEKLYREEQEKLFREQQEKEQQQKLLIEQQEKERQQKYIYEQQERERQQQLLFEQQEKEKQEKLLLEEKRQKELLIKEQQERKQQLLLQEQQDREQQLLLNRQQEFLLQQQIAQTLPSQFDFQSQTEATGTLYEQQTETQDASLIPHQPPLSIFYGSTKPQPRIPDLLRELRGAKTIPVLDQYLEVIPKFFVGPADMNPPKGYGKFDLPYLSNIDVSRVERKVNKLPFFVAPLNFIPPSGYSKIPFPAPHVGSVVVSSETTSRPTEKGSTPLPSLSSIRSTLTPKLDLNTQSPVTSYVQQISPKLRQKENRKPNDILSNPQLSNDFKTGPATTTVVPETTTQARTRRPFYRTKVRRPTTTGTLPVTRRPETVENSQIQNTETTEKKPSVKFPKRGRQRTKSTTDNSESDSLNSANQQYLIETSPTDTVKTFESEILKKEYVQDGTVKELVQGIFEVDSSEKRKVEQSNIDATTEPYTPLKNSPSTLGFNINDNTGYSVTTQRPLFLTSGSYEPTQRTVSTIGFDENGKTNYFPTTQPQPSLVEIENVGHTEFYEQTPRIPVGIENNGDSGFYNDPTFTSTGADFLYTTAKHTEKQITPDSKNYESVYSQEISRTKYDSGEEEKVYKQKQFSAEFAEDDKVDSHGKSKDEVARSTPKSTFYETSNPNNEQPTEFALQSDTFSSQKVKDNVAQGDRDQGRNEDYQQGHTPNVVRIKSRIRSKSRGQVNYANSQTTTPSPFVRKRVAYKSRKEKPSAIEGDEVRTVPKYRGQKKSYLTSTEAFAELEKTRNSHTPKPHRRTGVSAIVRRRKPTTSLPETTSQLSSQNYEIEYSPSGVSNEVLEDQIRESTQSRRQYSQNVITFTATTATEPPTTTEIYARRRDEIVEEQATTKAEDEGAEKYSSETISEFSKLVPTVTDREKDEGDEEPKKHQETKKAFDPSLEKKNARRRIRVRVHKRPHEHFEAAESQNLGTVANALIPPTSAKPSSEPDLYRLSKTGFNFDQSEKFAGTKNQAHVRNITSDILENTATFSAPGIESDGDLKRVTIVAEEKEGKHSATTMTTTTMMTTESAMETTTGPNEDEDAKEDVHIAEESSAEERTEETTTENGMDEEASTIFTTTENFETETEALMTEELTRETQMSTATEISHETEICFRGRCVKTNSATADDDLRKLVQSADKILKT